MRHRYRIREIAEQSGLSTATVDRVLHERPGVRPGTVAEVHQAIADLDRQHTQVRLVGRTFLIDLVMQAPARFTSAVRQALEAELPSLRPAVIRARFRLREEGEAAGLVRTLDEIRARGSHGVLLKAHDHPSIVGAIDRLTDKGIPVVTLVTDVPMSRRLAYVGMDNRAAGATAAYILTHCGSAAGPADERGVLVTLSSNAFRGEEEREMGFRAAMRELAPHRVIREVTETHGLDRPMLDAVSAVLHDAGSIDSVYSVGGGNTATLQAFREAGRRCVAFVAHDLDHDNAALLRQGHLTVVLHHDLRQDARRACRLIMQAHGALPGAPASIPSQIQVITPHNEPSAWGDL